MWLSTASAISRSLPIRWISTGIGTLPLRKPGILTLAARSLAACSTAWCTSCAGTSTVSRTWSPGSSSICVFTWPFKQRASTPAVGSPRADRHRPPGSDGGRRRRRPRRRGAACRLGLRGPQRGDRRAGPRQRPRRRRDARGGGRAGGGRCLRLPPPRRAPRGPGLVDVETRGGGAEQAEVVLSICPPHAALDVAAAFAGYDGIFVDANAVSPETARAVAARVGRFVDGGIVGGPPTAPGLTRLF